MKIAEIKKMDIATLNEKLAELRNRSRELRFSIANNQLKNVREARQVKTDIARILTMLNEKRIKEESK